MGIAEHLICDGHGAEDANTRRTIKSHHPCEQVYQHRRLVHAASLRLIKISVHDQVASAAPSTADRDSLADVVMEGAEGGKSQQYRTSRQKSTPLDVTNLEPQTTIRLAGGSADEKKSTASTFETRKRNRHARVGNVRVSISSRQFLCEEGVMQGSASGWKVDKLEEEGLFC